uniref:Uncharacterized protein n=1 Tax=Tetranychus urticae TaxID=32264 RepID=T1KJB6_TETUR
MLSSNETCGKVCTFSPLIIITHDSPLYRASCITKSQKEQGDQQITFKVSHD